MSLRIGGATINQIPMDWHGNYQRLSQLLKEAKKNKLDVLCLPELSLTGYGCEDWFLSIETFEHAKDLLNKLIKESIDMVVVFSLPVIYHGNLYNCAALVQNRKLLGFNPKKVLARSGVYYEPRWFNPWPFGHVDVIEWECEEIPIGDIHYQFGETVIAIEICEEAWDQEPASTKHARSGLDIVLNPSASHFAIGKYQTRLRMVAEISRAMQVQYVYTNLVGNEAGRIIYDGGVIIAECGQLIMQGPRFGFQDFYITYCDVNPKLPTMGRLKTRAVRHLSPIEEEQSRAVHGQPFKAHQQKLTVTNKTISEPEVYHAHEEFLLAETLGLFDYLRKSKSRSFVVSLSGGYDSSTCAVLVADMVKLALQELSTLDLIERLNIENDQKKFSSSAHVIRQLLTCIYMKTDNSSDATFEAAQALAHELNATFFHTDIQTQVDLYTRSVETWLNKKLTWSKDDISLQNIQARARAPLAWMVANLKSAILLATSNRSEAALGYTTMDGDTAGGLAPLAGVPKEFIRQWLKSRKDGALNLGTLDSLELVTNIPPTAELRPQEMKQTDEADLMPYKISRRIEECFIGNHQSSNEIIDILTKEFPEFSAKEIKSFVSKFMRLWSVSQWKRERFAPSFHIEDPSVDPKTWCRYPIL